MRTTTIERPNSDIDLPVITREFVDDSFERVTGAPLLYGNEVEILIDATENYPAWMDAVANAEDRIFFESYIIHGDEQGELFADALIKKAKEGVVVKLIYDWMGGFGKTSRRFWNRLRDNGVEVRCYNPPTLRDPLGVLSRDHRKCLVVDGKIAFVSGLCVGNDWVGDPAKNIPPWRDTGVGIRGPAVADVEAAFASVWKTMGEEIEPKLLVGDQQQNEAGDIALRVVQSKPTGSHIYRLDQILSAAARETMWLTDAYFIGVPSYLQSLKDAAEDGVDVRILVPRSTDIAIIGDTTRATYRPLLESGVRVFEWNGPMVHAKTAVFDGHFSRIGSTNLNIASWFSNYELDVFVEDTRFGEKMQQMFLNDLAGSTEIVISDTAKRKRKKLRIPARPEKGAGSMRKATAGALNAATSISSAIAKQASLGPAESKLLFMTAFVLLFLAAMLVLFPRAASIPLIILLLLLAIPTLGKAIKSYRNH